MDDDKVLVTYKGKILKESDLKFLKAPSYITGGLIEAYFAYLENRYHKVNKILLLQPAVAFGLWSYTEMAPVQEFLNGPWFRDMEVILFPVKSNETDVHCIESGSHWSLLVYDRKENLYFHFDSSSSKENKTFAWKLYTSTRLFTGSCTEPEYTEVIIQGQTNKYVGGLYVMKIASVICHWLANRRRTRVDSAEQCDCVTAVIKQVNPSLERDMRNEVERLVHAAVSISNPSKDHPTVIDKEHIGLTADQEVVVQYEGHELRRPDLEFLKGPCYVTDHLINFYFCLLYERFDNRDTILLVPPSISRWMSFYKHTYDIIELVGHLKLSSRQLVLFPLNSDSTIYKVETTQDYTHWSLLVHDVEAGLFFHLNNQRRETSFNDAIAELFHKKVKPWVPLKKGQGQEQPHPATLHTIMALRLAKGFNKYDCGLHVMAMAKLISERYARWEKLLGAPGVQPRGAPGASGPFIIIIKL